jgi:hypothetical protein
MYTVKWKKDKLTNFTGRNGYMLCSGIEVLPMSFDDKVMLTPVTGKDRLGRCDIAIPTESIDELIKTLRAAKKYIKATK